PIQEALLEELVEAAEAEEVDLVLVAGDVFDTYNPPFKAEKLLYRTLVRLSAGGRRLVVVCAGNHDAPEKFEVPRPLMAGLSGIVLAARPEEDLRLFSGETPYFRFEMKDGFLRVHFKERNRIVALRILPYPSEVRWGLAGEAYEERLRSFLAAEPAFTADHFFVLSHLWAQGAEASGSERLFLGGLERVPVEYFSPAADYVALGHLHRFQEPSSGLVYAGSIFPFDLSEARQEKGFVLWREGDVSFRPLRRRPEVRELTFESVEAALAAAGDDEALVFLRFPPLNPGPQAISRLREAYRGRLLGLHFEVPVEQRPRQMVRHFSPEELFRAFLREKTAQEPKEELVAHFLRFLRED
ncbi:MAG: exonuclease SbcCD subunit D, partial [Thermodesulfobacteria bacterium]|nr:exonuclease SbcCD subunit D [Thermodesulfobacteriota bacterium]